MRQNIEMDGAAAWIVIEAVLRRLVERGLMTWDEVDVLIASAEEKARQKVLEEYKAERFRRS
ncbi:hypothetical protein [Deinococcus sp. Leaf326]|uniref:hypothetical protein n=1 Tax=Deinococcus sp. Leaf326 TaxID=1736338 RepID=UPI0006F67250|nr:hypothetical protein [Deinococcus sp. Leaf326]KQR07443.1 hypothetical protein ASF71_20930 [Deinococcus sp. Leaf326]